MAFSAIGAYFGRIFSTKQHHRQHHREERTPHTAQQQSQHERAGQTDNRQMRRTVSESSSEALRERLKSESYRLTTFNDTWDEHCPGLPGYKLAKAGFFYINAGDKVQCAFCLGILYGFCPGDEPEQIHRTVFDRCPFMLGENVGNVPIILFADNSTSELQKDENVGEMKIVAELGLVWMKPRGIPGMQTLISRLETYVNSSEEWKRKKICTKKLAKAGFFYTGPGVNVMCYQCECKISKWALKEDPWTVHARANPRCPHVNFMKGPKFGLVCASADKSGDNDEPAAESSSASDPQQQEESSLDSGFFDDGPDEQEYQETDSGLLAAQSNDVAPAGSNTGDSPCAGSSSSSDEDCDGASIGNKKNSSDARKPRMKKCPLECQICMVGRPITVLMLPCRHLCSCKSCAIQVSKCPLCRSDIKAMVECYLLT